MRPTSHRVEHLLTQHYPAIYRMAFALTGRADLAHGVIRHMLQRGLERTAGHRQQPPERWFEHHTVLTTRRAQREPPDPRSDTLVIASPLKTPGYVAFIRAVRALPFQQREAFILHHGGNFDNRRLAVAMDCSTEAAANHLRGADNAIRAVTEQLFDPCVSALQKAYASLLPTEDVYLPPLQRSIRRNLRRRRILRLAGWVIILALLALSIWAVKTLLPLLDY